MNPDNSGTYKREMEDFLLALLAGLAELLFEVLFQLFLESIVALITRSIQNLFEESGPASPVLAAIGYLLLGAGLGLASVFVFPHHIFRPSRFHGVSLLISPLVTGLIMSQVGTLLHRKGKETVRIESFAYGFMFALGWAVVRFVSTL
jgi:hypothetical protein